MNYVDVLFFPCCPMRQGADGRISPFLYKVGNSIGAFCMLDKTFPAKTLTGKLLWLWLAGRWRCCKQNELFEHSLEVAGEKNLLLVFVCMRTVYCTLNKNYPAVL